MRARVLLALLLLSSMRLPAQSATALVPTTVLASASQRQATSLDGQWHYLVDPYRGQWDNFITGLPLPKPTGAVANTHPDPHGPVQEYNWPQEPTLAVPGDWNSQRPELLYYEGLLWYERDFTFHPKAGMRTFLHFGAAAYRANVTVNGKNVCEHQGAFTSFDCDATAMLKDGSNFIVVAIDNMRLPERVPTTKTDWWNYGGLTGSVSLVEVPEAYIDDDALTLERGPGDRITGFAHVVDAQPGTAVSVSIPELGIQSASKTDADGRAAFSLTPRSLERWSPDHPRLYRVEWQVGQGTGSDRLHDEVGFRTIEVRGTELLLNGKPIFLRGISMHAEAPRHYPDYPGSLTGRAATDEDAKLMLGRAKALDCNFVRMAHYPHPEATVREADKLGLLLWEEIPVYWAIQWNNPDTLASARQQLHEMIRRDRNRASIIFWSMSNETPISPERTEFIHKLVDQARSEDSSRLITSALLTPMHPDASGVLTATLDDPLGRYLDVLGQNEYVGWYVGKSDDAPGIRWVDPLGKPVIISEFGGSARAGRHGAVDDRWTEEFQAHLFQEQFQMAAKIPFLVGMTPWVLMDFRSPTRLLPGIQDSYNRKGLFSPEGDKKEVYEVVHRRYQELEADPPGTK